MKVFDRREEISKFSHLASFEEVKENDFNLNIPRYVDTFEEEEEIDVMALQNEIESLEVELSQVRSKMSINTTGDQAMNKDLVEITHHQTFESLKQEEDGCEFWSARKLQRFSNTLNIVIFFLLLKKQKKHVKTADTYIVDHFEDILEMVDIGSGGQRQIADVRLSRYACYLIVQNGDPAKPVIANGQTYFAIQTRRQELS